jgi:hypothetical protein
MSAVRITIKPDIAGPKVRAFNDDSRRMDFADFAGNIGEYQVSFCFGEHEVSYGVCFLFDYYMDICQELHSMAQGMDHDIEMSGYPVACIAVCGSDEAKLIIFSADKNGKPRDYEEIVSRQEFIEELRATKALIEHHVRGQ